MKVIKGGIITAMLLFSAAIHGEAEGNKLRPLAPDAVPPAGNFYSAQLTNSPPLPFNPFPDLPLYSLGDNSYAYDDRDFDYVAMEQERQTLRLLHRAAALSLSLESGVPAPPGDGGSGEDPGSGSPPPAYDYPQGSLWLEITAVTNDAAYLTLHGTELDAYYQIQSKTDLTGAGWVLEREFYGDDGETLIRPGIATLGRPAMFYRAAAQPGTVVSIAPNQYFPFAVEPVSPSGNPVQIGKFNVQRTGATDANLTVHYQASGTAEAGVDYTNLTGAVTIPAGYSQTDVYIHPLYDGVIEFEEPLRLTLVPTNGYLVDASRMSAMITVNDSTNTLFSIVATNLDFPVELDYHAPSNSILMSYNYTWNTFVYPTNNFGRLGTNGVVSSWSGVSGVQEEVKFAVAKPNALGFTNGDLFYGAGFDGAGNALIGRVAANGQTWTNQWCVLTNETDRLRGSLYVDQTGVWGGDLIAVTGDESVTTGTRGIWRVNSNGIPQEVARLNTPHLEGVITLTNDVTKWGPWAGKILTGDERRYNEDDVLDPVVYAVDTNGVATSYALGIEPEDFDVIPPNQDLYCADPSVGILKLSKSWLTNYVGDLLITQAGEMRPHLAAKLFIVHWSGTNLTTRSISLPSSVGGGFEHVTFAPINIPSIAP